MGGRSDLYKLADYVPVVQARSWLGNHHRAGVGGKFPPQAYQFPADAVLADVNARRMQPSTRESRSRLRIVLWASGGKLSRTLIRGRRCLARQLRADAEVRQFRQWPAALPAVPTRRMHANPSRSLDLRNADFVPEFPEMNPMIFCVRHHARIVPRELAGGYRILCDRHR